MQAPKDEEIIVKNGNGIMDSTGILIMFIL